MACRFNGGLPCPQDCVRDGGKTACVDPEPVQDVTGIPSTDPDLWKYSNCDYNLDNAPNAATWCYAAGGTWPGLPNWQCNGLSLPPFISQFGYTDIGPLEPTADNYVTRKGLCQYTKTTTSWGVTRPAGDRCWEGGPNSQYGILNGQVRIATYNGYTTNTNGQCNVPATQVIAQKRTRAIGCPKDYTLRGWANGSTWRCYREIEDICPLGNPVQPFAGTKLESFAIDAGPEIGDLLTLEYSSAARPRTLHPRTLGSHWGLRFEKQLVTETGTAGTVRTIIHAVGAPEYFGADGWSVIASREGKTRLVIEGNETHWIDARNQRWTFNQSGQLVRLRRVDGSEVAFTYAPNYFYLTPKSGRMVTISTKPNETTFSINHPAVSALLTADRNITALTRSGSTVNFAYTDSRFPTALTAIKDETGRTVTSYVYDAAGKVSNEYHWPAGTAVQRYAFSRTNSSILATWPLGALTTYTTTTADGVRRLSTVSQFCPSCPSGNVAGYAYDGNGNVLTTTAFNGIQTSHQRNPAGWTTLLTEVSNASCPAGQPNCLAARRTTETEWDSTWRVPLLSRVRSGDASGPVQALTRRAINSRGQVTAICTVDADDATAAAYACGSQANAPARVRQTTHRYCEAGDADFGGSLCPFVGYLRSSNGPRTDVADVTTYEYRASDDPGCITPPFTCNYRRGDLWKVTNAAGQVQEHLAYDASGRLLRTRDPNLVITDLQYHLRGWLVSRTVRANADGSPSPADSQTRIEHESYGEIRRIIEADGSAIEYCRDQTHRITATVLAQSAQSSRCNGPTPLAGTASIRYTLDNQGNRIREESRDTDGSLRKLLARQYNTLGQMRGLVQSRYANQPNLDDPLQVRKTTFSYDVNGRPDQTVDAKGVVFDQDHDPLDRLIQQFQDKDMPSTSGEINARIGYEYDALSRVRRVTDPRGLVTEYRYDGLGDQIALQSPDTKSTEFQRDSAGNVARHIDARGSTSDYTYDALNRPTSRSFVNDSNLNETFQYDQLHAECSADERSPLGRLTRFTDASGETRFCYDRRGNLRRKTQVTDGNEQVVRYAYDAANRLVALTYPSGNTVAYGRDAHGRINSVSLTGNGTSMTLVSNVSYLPFGPISAIQFGDGQVLNKQWDQDYWPDLVSSPALNYDFGTDDRGDITQVLSGIEGNQTLEYDNLQRLTRVLAAGSPLETLTYDATGNRQSVRFGAANPISYDYTDPSSHRLTAVGGRARTYDQAGNTISGHLPSDGGTQLLANFNAANRFSQVLRPSATKAQPSPWSSVYFNWTYNARGERVAGSQGAGPSQFPSRQYLYDESGRILSVWQDYTQSTPPQNSEIVWIDQTPVAQVETVQAWSGTTVRYVRYIHSDHLNTPRALSNARTQDNQPAGTVVWRWRLNQSGTAGSNAFGTRPADEDPDGNGLPVAFDLRFPGQLYDQPTGTHYNYFRDYEPATGRYLESDPIGLKGGMSTFGYVGQNVLKYYDPLGLESWGGCPGGGVAPTGTCETPLLPPRPKKPLSCAAKCNIKAVLICSLAGFLPANWPIIAGGGCAIVSIVICDDCEETPSCPATTSPPPLALPPGP